MKNLLRVVMFLGMAIVLASLVFYMADAQAPEARHQITNANYLNLGDWLYKYSTKQGYAGKDTLIQIKDRTYAASQIDTTEAIPCRNFKSIYVSVATKDSLSMLIRYRLSLDGFSWGNSTTLDSLVYVTTTGVGVKNVDFTSTIGGFSFVQFVFTVQAWQRGTTTPTYSARYTLKKY
jgi:hypothetical protein